MWIINKTVNVLKDQPLKAYRSISLIQKIIILLLELGYNREPEIPSALIPNFLNQCFPKSNNKIGVTVSGKGFRLHHEA